PQPPYPHARVGGEKNGRKPRFPPRNRSVVKTPQPVKITTKRTKKRVQNSGDHTTPKHICITHGKATGEALADKKDIRRYGHSYVPLDEALSRVVIDLSGRPGLVYIIEFTRALIG
ncbi:hypothetical protein CWI58_03485, partial [Neisseria meningitidis]